MWQFLYFSRWRPPAILILKVQNFNCHHSSDTQCSSLFVPIAETADIAIFQLSRWLPSTTLDWTYACLDPHKEYLALKYIYRNHKWKIYSEWETAEQKTVIIICNDYLSVSEIYNRKLQWHLGFQNTDSGQNDGRSYCLLFWNKPGIIVSEWMYPACIRWILTYHNAHQQ